MDHSLTTYKNLQYNPIDISSFCVVEVYKDEINSSNALGYFIQPLTGITDIKATIADRVWGQPEAGYDNLVVLAGRDFDTFDRRIVYAVWYNGDTPPQYPSEPTVAQLKEPAGSSSHYQEIVIENDGAPTYCTITLTLVGLSEPVDFYLNDDYYKIDVSTQIPSVKKILTIDRTGVMYNGKHINTYDSLAVPKLNFGTNILRMSNLSTSKVKVEFNQKF